MSALHDTTLPASRLRKGDVLPAHGATATIGQVPVTSVDGSMVTLVVEHAPEDTRLLRIPVDQPVQVRRPASAPNAFIRKATLARSSGTQILVLDLSQPDSEIPPIGKDRYANLCVAHHTIRFHAAVSTAEARASHPEEWCAQCRRATRERAQARLNPRIERKLA